MYTNRGKVNMSKKIFRLVHQEARRRAMACVDEAPEGHTVTVAEPTRNADQNAKFHALCGDLEKSRVEWMGRRRSAKQWKVLLVSGHATATKDETPEIVAGLEGEWVNIRESTALMSVRRSSSLIEYTLAFMAMHYVMEAA